MHITYDVKADALYIKLKEGEFLRGREVEPGMVLDIGQNNDLLGIEILDASTRFGMSSITKISMEMLGIPGTA